MLTQLTLDQALAQLDQMNKQLEECREARQTLARENIDLRAQLKDEQEASARLNEDYTKLLNWQDLTMRTFHNRNVSPIYQKLYLAMVDAYPDLLSNAGERVPIQVWQIRENAGWVSKASATKFFQDFVAIGAIQYDPGKFNKKEEDRIGYVTANPDLFPYPEQFDTKAAEKRRKAREEEEKRRKKYKHALQVLMCEECGSNDIVHDVTATCKACGHVHETLKNIPSSLIMIEPEIIEEAEEQYAALDFDEEEPEPEPAYEALEIDFSAPAPQPQIQYGPKPDGRPCPDCAQTLYWYPVPTTWGGTIYNCGNCLPPNEFFTEETKGVLTL